MALKELAVCLPVQDFAGPEVDEGLAVPGFLVQGLVVPAVVEGLAVLVDAHDPDVIVGVQALHDYRGDDHGWGGLRAADDRYDSVAVSRQSGGSCYLLGYDDLGCHDRWAVTGCHRAAVHDHCHYSRSEGSDLGCHEEEECMVVVDFLHEEVVAHRDHCHSHVPGDLLVAARPILFVLNPVVPVEGHVQGCSRNPGSYLLRNFPHLQLQLRPLPMTDRQFPHFHLAHFPTLSLLFLLLADVHHKCSSNASQKLVRLLIRQNHKQSHQQ